jgi:hypothetical protein
VKRITKSTISRLGHTFHELRFTFHEQPCQAAF